ncbi:hypothetical protein HED60_15360 [Planctomycetales bacterium ZRK34]|nr:hypothetical protein HED60_15360 [Planctomycetales bacterium ZRK34]
MTNHPEPSWITSTPDDDDWIALALRCLSGEATPDDVASLNHRLRDEPRLLSLYAALAIEEQHLRESLAPTATESGPAGVTSYSTRTSHRLMIVKTVLATAAVFVLLVVAWVMTQQELPAPKAPSSKAAPTTAGMLTDVDQAVFGESAAPMVPGGALPPGLIKLASGRAQLMFNSMAVVDLVGPCEFEMVDSNRGRLAVGHAEVFVPEQARGFSIDLPDGIRVIDLGTRFEVDVDRAGRVVIQVIEGRVQVVGKDQQMELVAYEGAVTTASGQLKRSVMLASWNNQQVGGDVPSLDVKIGAPQWISQPTVTLGSGLTMPPDAEPGTFNIEGGEIVLISAAEGTADDTTTLADAMADQQYIEFALTVTGLRPDQVLHLKSFSYATWRNLAGRRHGWADSQVAVSVNDAPFTVEQGVGPVNREQEYRKVYNREVSLNTVQSIRNGDTIRIRIYAWGSDATQIDPTGGSRPFHSGTRLGNIHLFGSVQSGASPETKPSNSTSHRTTKSQENLS